MDLTDALAVLARVTRWHVRGGRVGRRFARASFNAYTICGVSHIAKVTIRQRNNESTADMIARGATELLRRMSEGMPPIDPKKVAHRLELAAVRNAKRVLYSAVSPSKHVN